MRRSLENPVARHAGRLVGRGGRPWAIVLLLLGAVLLGGLLQRYWMEMEDYTSLHPHAITRWLGLALVAETVVALPWAAVRGALLWRRLRDEGHLDEYRRSRLSPLSIAWGAVTAALRPVLLLLAFSLALTVATGAVTRGLPLGGAVVAHLLLAVQAVAFAALGLWLAGILRYPAAAVPVALVLLAAAVAAIWMVDPLYRRVEDPTPLIYWALVPNPVTAVGNALETDVLRFSWVYRHLHAHEYFFTYPPAWQTGSLYCAAAALFLLGVRGQVACREA